MGQSQQKPTAATTSHTPSQPSHSEKFHQEIQHVLSVASSHNSSSSEKMSHSVTPSRPIPIIFDTDIGSDIDDALALLSLLNLPEEAVHIEGVTTVYGYVEIRSGVARRIIQAHREDYPSLYDIPVRTGSNFPIGYPPVLPYWHAGTEGIGLFTHDQIEQMKSEQDCTQDQSTLEKNHSKQAAEFIVEKARQWNGQLVIISVGALTNVAMALQMESNLPNLVNKVVFMGGGVFPHNEKVDLPVQPQKEYHCHSCHNMRQDQFAANLVFSSGLTCYLVGHTVTHDMWFTGDTVDQLRSLSFHTGTDPYTNDCVNFSHRDPNCKNSTHVVGTLLDVWLKHRTKIFHKNMNGTCPHDALTSYEAVWTGSFVEYVAGHFVVNEGTGETCFVGDEEGGHVHVAVKFRDGMVDRMMRLLSESLVRRIGWEELEGFGVKME